MIANVPRTSQADEIAAAAARLIGTPEQLAARLRNLLDEGAPKPSPRESAADRREREAETAAHERAVAAHRHRLAADFAEARGWRPTTVPLAVKELARRGYPGGTWHRPAREWLGTMFHPAFYRDAGRRAAAMVAHPLATQVERDRADIEAWAAERDLTATFSEEVSWQHPGQAVVVIFEPREPAEGNAPTPHAEPQLDTPAAPPTAPDLATLRPIEPIARPHAAPDAQQQGTTSDPDEDTAMPEPSAQPAMRPIEPVDLGDITPRDLASETEPELDIAVPAELLIDARYQRDLTPKSLALIRRIVENWSWSRFKVPTCVRVDGQLHVIDGQHTAIAAATHGGITAIPVLVVSAPEVTDRAAAFVSHATDRVQATITQVHHAAVLAGDEDAVTIDRVCRAAGVELMAYPPPRSAYRPRQTIALTAIRRVIDKRGAMRGRQVLEALAKADLAPISADHIRAAEALLCDPDIAGEVDADRITAGMRAMAARGYADAKTLAATKNVTLWRAMVAVILKNRRARPKGARPDEGEAA